MFGKQVSKEQLSQMLRDKCDQAMLLDRGVHTLYASQPLPTKSKYKPRKTRPDPFQEEIARLAAAKKEGATTPVRDEPQSEMEDLPPRVDIDVSQLETDLALFLRERGRK